LFSILRRFFRVFVVSVYVVVDVVLGASVVVEVVDVSSVLV